jgi:hypothetical protein
MAGQRVPTRIFQRRGSKPSFKTDLAALDEVLETRAMADELFESNREYLKGWK